MNMLVLTVRLCSHGLGLAILGCANESPGMLPLSLLSVRQSGVTSLEKSSEKRRWNLQTCPRCWITWRD